MKKLITSLAIGFGVAACPIVVNAEEIPAETPQDNQESESVVEPEGAFGEVTSSATVGANVLETPIISEEIADGLSKIQAEIEEVNRLHDDAQSATESYIDTASLVQEIIDKDAKECEEYAKEADGLTVDINKTLENVELKTKEINAKVEVVQKKYNNAVEKTTVAQEKLAEIKEKNGLNEGNELKGDAKELIDKSSDDISRAEKEVSTAKENLEKATSKRDEAKKIYDGYEDAITKYNDIDEEYQNKKLYADSVNAKVLEATETAKEAENERLLADSELIDINKEKDISDEKLKNAAENYSKAKEELDAAKQLNNYDAIKKYYDELVEKADHYQTKLDSLEPLINEAATARDKADYMLEEKQDEYDAAYEKAQLPTATEEDKRLVERLSEELDLAWEKSDEAWSLYGELAADKADNEDNLKIVRRELGPATDDYNRVCALIKDRQSAADEQLKIQESLKEENAELSVKKEKTEQRLREANSSKSSADLKLKNLQEEYSAAYKTAETVWSEREALVESYNEASKYIDSARVVLEYANSELQLVEKVLENSETKLNNALEVKKIVVAKIADLRGLSFNSIVSTERIESIDTSLKSALSALEIVRIAAQKSIEIIDGRTHSIVSTDNSNQGARESYSTETVTNSLTPGIDSTTPVTDNSSQVTNDTVTVTTIHDDVVPLSGEQGETNKGQSGGDSKKQESNTNGTKTIKNPTTPKKGETIKKNINKTIPAAVVGAVLALGGLVTLLFKKRAQ